METDSGTKHPTSGITPEDIDKARRFNREARAEVGRISSKGNKDEATEAPFSAKMRRQLNEQYMMFFSKIRTDQIPASQIAESVLELTLRTLAPILTEEADRIDLEIEALQMENSAWMAIAAARDELRAAVELRRRFAR